MEQYKFTKMEQYKFTKMEQYKFTKMEQYKFTKKEQYKTCYPVDNKIKNSSGSSPCGFCLGLVAACRNWFQSIGCFVIHWITAIVTRYKKQGYMVGA